MSRMLLSPGRYVQGAGAIKEIGLHTSRIGTCALVIGGKTALSLCGPDILASLAEKGIPCHQECFQGISSQQEIRRLTGIAAANRADIIIALGGGASIDAAKAAAAVAEGETIHSTWFPVSVDMVEAAIWTADALGTRFKKALR